MQSHENSSELLSEILSQVELHHDRCFGTLWNPTPPKKITSYAFIVYYTKYLIFILSDLLKSIISAYYTCKGTRHLAQKLSLDAFVKQVANTFGQKFKKGSERCILQKTHWFPLKIDVFQKSLCHFLHFFSYFWLDCIVKGNR